MGLSGRPHKLSSRVREGGLPSPEESGISLNRQRIVGERSGGVPWLTPKWEMLGSPDESGKQC